MRERDWAHASRQLRACAFRGQGLCAVSKRSTLRFSTSSRASSSTLTAPWRICLRPRPPPVRPPRPAPLPPAVPTSSCATTTPLTGRATCEPGLEAATPNRQADAGCATSSAAYTGQLCRSAAARSPHSPSPQAGHASRASSSSRCTRPRCACRAPMPRWRCCARRPMRTSTRRRRWCATRCPTAWRCARPPSACRPRTAPGWPRRSKSSAARRRSSRWSCAAIRTT